MEQHPVPQNIIEVEFKLFGSFTLKQFSKILAGSLAALLIFFIPMPTIIKFPLMGLSIILGLGMAIIPNLSVWLNGMLKAIFISPRYVWVRETEVPDLLKAKEVTRKSSADLKVGGAKSTNKVDINDLPLERLFGTKSKIDNVRKDDMNMRPNKVSEDNFVRVYADVYGDDIFKRDENSPVNLLSREKTLPEKPPVQLAVNQIGVKQEAHNIPTRTIQDYNSEIQKLKIELSKLSKDQNYKEKEEEILTRINDLYQEIRILSSYSDDAVKVPQGVKNAPQVDTSKTRNILGIVVNKGDSPIANAAVTFIDETSHIAYKTFTSRDGKFSTATPLPYGRYAVKIDDPKYKFHTYEIEIGDQNSPAYKFREK